MGTPLKDVYDRFISKLDEDLTGKESLIFQYLISAKSKIYKTTKHSLVYVLDTIFPESYNGNFVEILDDDEIELMAMQMKYEHYYRKEAYLLAQKRELGTKDFEKLPNKKQELDGIQNSLKLLKVDIEDLKQEFNTYKYD